MKADDRAPLARRSFLARLGAGAGALGAAVAAGGVQVQAADAGRWQPARHAQDDWLDQVPGKHRFVFDTTTPEAFARALFYASNYFTANQSAYGLQGSDLAVVIIARHFSTPFAYNDAMWAKHGAALADAIKFADPKSKQAPTGNPSNSPAVGLPNNGVTLESMLKKGLHLGVCQMATQFFAGVVAGQDGNKDSTYKELIANLMPNAHLVSAGIVAVNRAQERGYSFACTG